MTICERMFQTIAESPKKNAAGLCKKLGIGTSVTTGWKQRNADPPAKYIAQICEYLEVSIEFLLTGVETDLDKANRFQSSMTEDERRIVAKYRMLDDDGKDAVRGTLLQEQRRVEAEKGMATTSAS